MLHSFTCRLPMPLIQRLKLRAVRERRSLQELAAEAITAYLKRGREDHDEAE